MGQCKRLRLTLQFAFAEYLSKVSILSQQPTQLSEILPCSFNIFAHSFGKMLMGAFLGVEAKIAFWPRCVKLKKILGSKI